MIDFEIYELEEDDTALLPRAKGKPVHTGQLQTLKQLRNALKTETEGRFAVRALFRYPETDDLSIVAGFPQHRRYGVNIGFIDSRGETHHFIERELNTAAWRELLKTFEIGAAQ